MLEVILAAPAALVMVVAIVCIAKAESETRLGRAVVLCCAAMVLMGTGIASVWAIDLARNRADACDSLARKVVDLAERSGR